MRPAQRQLVLLLSAVVCCLLLVQGRAQAADAPAPAQLSSVVVAADRSVAGLLSVPGTLDGVETDSLRVRIGTESHSVRTVPVEQTRRATMIVIDTSGSMGTTGMETVRTAVGAFLGTVPGDVQVGVVAFSQGARVVVPLTTDRAAVTRGVATLTADGETALYDGVSLAVSRLGTQGDRNLLILSDGADTSSRVAESAVVTSLTTTKTHAQVIGFHTGSSDNAVLARFASAGHGSVVAADNAAAVRTAFGQAGQQLESQVRWVVQAADDLGGRQTLTISGTAGGRAFSGSIPIELGKALESSVATPTAVAPVAQPAAPAVVAVVPVALGLPASVLVALGAVFLGLTAFIVALAAPVFRRRGANRIRALEEYLNPASAQPVEAPSAGLADGLVAFGDRMMKDKESTSRLIASLQQADLPLRAGEWWVLRLVSVVVCAAAGLVLMGGHGPGVFGMLLGLVLGIFAPAMVLRVLVRRRLRQFERQLPDVLTMVASSLSTGFSLMQGLDAVAHDAAEPASKEFARALAEARIGSDIEVSLRRLAERMESSSMEWTTMAIEIQRQVGGNLAETLRTTAATLREREMLRRQVAGLSAEGKLSSYILIALPVGIFLFSLKTNYEYVSLLWTTMLGGIMSVAGLISMAIGVFWMRKIVVVEV